MDRQKDEWVEGIGRKVEGTGRKDVDHEFKGKREQDKEYQEGFGRAIILTDHVLHIL